MTWNMVSMKIEKGQMKETSPDSLDRGIELIKILHEEVSSFDKGIDHGGTEVLMTRIHPWHKTKMFNLFTRIFDHSQKTKDSELTKYVQETTDCWSLMMLEEHQHTQIFIHNMHDM